MRVGLISACITGLIFFSSCHKEYYKPVDENISIDSYGDMGGEDALLIRCDTSGFCGIWDGDPDSANHKFNGMSGTFDGVNN